MYSTYNREYELRLVLYSDYKSHTYPRGGSCGNQNPPLLSITKTSALLIHFCFLFPIRKQRNQPTQPISSPNPQTPSITYPPLIIYFSNTHLLNPIPIPVAYPYLECMCLCHCHRRRSGITYLLMNLSLFDFGWEEHLQCNWDE